MSWLKVELSEDVFNEAGSMAILRDIDASLQHYPHLKRTFFVMKKVTINNGVIYYFYNAPNVIINDLLVLFHAKTCGSPDKDTYLYVYGDRSLFDEFYHNLNIHQITK